MATKLRSLKSNIFGFLFFTHKYKKQIEIYADVLSKLTGKKVKEKYLYIFGIDEQVKVDLIIIGFKR